MKLGHTIPYPLLDGRIICSSLILCSIEHPCWVADNRRAIRHIAGNNRAGAHHRAGAHLNLTNKRRASA